jgi:rhamnogalacturonan endolyase
MKYAATALLALVMPAAAQAASPCPSVDLFHDDFSGFPAGLLSAPIGQLNGAVQEYHYLPHRGVPLGPWSNPIAHLDPWVASDEDGRPYLEQHLAYELPQQTAPLFITGDTEWSDTTVSARVRPLAVNGTAGLVFRYETNRKFYAVVFTGGKALRLFERLPLETTFRVAGEREVAQAPFPYGSTRYYALRVENDGPRVRAFVDEKLVLTADLGPGRGKAGVVAAVPARFQDFRVTTCATSRAAIEKRIEAREAEMKALRADNPQPRLWKKLETPKFGAGRNVRFGDLDGDGILDMLIAQNVPRVRGDAFDHISALTAMTLEGKVLWQLGKPDPRNGLLTNDSPFQIQDMDGDGKNDVVLVRDFKLQILDGATGKPKGPSVLLPPMTDANAPYALNNADALCLFDAKGAGVRRDVLVKDRYKHFWAYDARLQKLFEGETNTGHFPFPTDVDGDGRDELAIGYSLWDAAGKRLWDRDDELDDHADAVVIGNFTADPKAPKRVYWVGSDEGFVMADLQGKILVHQRIGHGQNLSVGRFRPEMPGLQILTVNFWKNPGIVSVFDPDGTLLQQAEPIHSGSELLPVNWRGDGTEFALLSGNVREGGMIDGHLRRVVMFPDDDHPDLAAHVLDLTGDARDEIVLWDQERVWIYTQDRPFTGPRIYAPARNPLYNDSNYRANVSLPGWKDVP